MWCARCQADVAADAVPDSRRMRCVACGTELTVSLAAPPAESRPQRDPHELLARWAEDRMLDPFGPLAKPPADSTPPTPPPAAPPAPLTPAPRTPPVARIEPAHGPAGASPPPAPHRKRLRRSGSVPPPNRRRDTTQAVRQPHFETRRAAPSKPAPPTSNWIAGAGQFCAYLGVATLTIGTAMVIYGYFGGPAEFAPNGWLITTIGQMLLFLGVITLVSGGIEQTTHEVARRIDALGEKLLRIEDGEEGPRGPSFPIPHRRPGGGGDHLAERIARLERQFEDRG